MHCNMCEAWDGQSWAPFPRMNRRRAGHAAVVVGGQLVVWGGHSSGEVQPFKPRPQDAASSSRSGQYHVEVTIAPGESAEPAYQPFEVIPENVPHKFIADWNDCYEQSSCAASPQQPAGSADS